MANEYDKIIKENLQSVILRLISKTTDVEAVEGEILYPELHYTLEREADFIERIKTLDGQTFIFHLEFQTANDKVMLERMFAYAGLIYQTYRLPLRQLVFYIGKAPVNMPTTLTMPKFEYQYELIDLQQIPYETFLQSDIPEEVLLAILCNFGQSRAELVVEQIFHKLRDINESDLRLMRHIRQLDMLSLLRNLQSVVLQNERKMALALDINNDLRVQEAKREMVIAMLKEGINIELISRITQLPLSVIDELQVKLQAKKKKK